MISKRKSLGWLMGLCLVVAPDMVLAGSEGSLTNFSEFTVGYESVQYDEATTGGITASGPRMGNIIQRSSGYTSVTSSFGFYITTSSTLVANAEQEQWNLPIYGNVQNDQRKMRMTDVNMEAAWKAFGGVQLLLGLGLNTMSFSRSGFTYPQGTQGTLGPGGFVADPNGPIQQLVNGGNIQYLARQSGAVFEDSSTLLGRIGLRYDAFVAGSRGLHWRAGFNAGIPLYYRVENSNFPNSSWSSTFKGYNVSTDAGLGFKFKNDLDLTMLASYSKRHRPETNKDASGAFVPRVDVDLFRLAAGLTWRF